MLEELPTLPTIEGFEELVVGSAAQGVVPKIKTDENVEVIQKPKLKRRILSERERLIATYHDTLLAAAQRLKADNKSQLSQTVLLFDLHKNELFFREDDWDFISDFGLNVYVGQIKHNSTNVNELVSNFILDILFDNYQLRDKLSIFPELIEAKDVFLKVLELERREILFRSRLGFNYADKISYKLHDLCGMVIDAFLNNGFFDSVPEQMVEKQFEIPGWTSSRVIRMLEDGKGKVNLFQLVELGIRLGHLTSQVDGKVDELILAKLDDLLVDWFKENESEDFIMLIKASGCKYPFLGTQMPKGQIESFPKFFKEAKLFGVDFLGEDEII